MISTVTPGTDVREGVAQGHYAEKQLNCRSSVIAFSHRARFLKALELVGSDPDGLLLDYGSGDGTFLSMVGDRFKASVGADIATDQVEDCRKRFAGVPGVSFCELRDLASSAHAGAYAVVTCMETLEHCPADAVRTALRDISRLVAADGKVVISVPIETGLSFILKYAVRTVAGWRGLSDYRHYERYGAADALRMIFATSRTRVPRPIYSGGGFEFHSHYGFNWRHIAREAEAVMTIERVTFSPFPYLGASLNSQAWLVCRRR
jgi:SAM-dependent methyltransferase